MAYNRDWEKLEESVGRLKRSNIPDDDARADLCAAIADRKIKVRALVSTSDHNYAGCSLEDSQIGIPLHLFPSDFDWNRSLPLGNWEGGRYPGDIDWGERIFSLLELFTRDVISVFSLASSASAAYQTQLPGRPSSKQLIELEFAARRERGTIEGTLAKEAAYLERWLREAHSAAPRATAQTIENQIRLAYKAAKEVTK